MAERSRQKKYRSTKTGKEEVQKSTKDRFRRQQRLRTEHHHVNRNEVCPFLARIYYCVNGVNHYSKEIDLPKDRELVLYLWMDSSLKELADLLRAHLPVIRTKQRFVFTRVYQAAGKFVGKQMGTVMIHKKDRKGFENEETTLGDHQFCIGDYIDVSINYK